MEDGASCPTFFSVFLTVSRIVDDFAIVHENTQQVSNFQVIPVTEVIDKLNLMGDWVDWVGV